MFIAMFLWILLSISSSWALTTTQLQALKTDITVTRASVVCDGQTHLQWWNAGNDIKVAECYNRTAIPDFWVWRTSVTKDELVNSTSVDGTTFNWTGLGFIGRTQGERDAWRELFGANGAVNPSLLQVRQAFQDIFSGGTAPAPANRTHLATVARRKASYAEQLFATGTGSTVSPGTMVFEGSLTGTDVGQSRSA